jgi:hypothetical protein
MKLLLALILLTSLTFAQQPQIQNAPLQRENVKYVQGYGVGGYAVSPGSGLTLNIGPGTTSCAGSLVEYPGGTLAMADNTTNYVYLDPTNSCAPTASATPWDQTQIWLYKVVTASGAITPVTGIDDVRTPFAVSAINLGGTHVCQMDLGADNAASALVDADLGPQKRLCFVPKDSHIIEIRVSADAGTPQVILQRRRGPSTTAALVSGALATAASGEEACALGIISGTCIGGLTSSGTITLSNTALLAGDYIELLSGTAGGTAKSMQIAVTVTED